MNARFFTLSLASLTFAYLAMPVARAADKPAPAQCPCCAMDCRNAAPAVAPAPTTATPTTVAPTAPVPTAATPATRPSPQGRGMGMGMGMGNGGPMKFIHALLDAHLKISRLVKEIPGGVETLTTSDDPAVARTIVAHVHQVHDRMQAGQPIRMWDPLFVELFRHRSEIKMEIADVPGGVKVITTSQNPQVTLLIRQHATRGVDEFVAQGWDRVHKPTTLPSDYKQAKQDSAPRPAGKK